MVTYNLGHVVGAAGKGISNITKTGTSGLVDTYTITYTDATTSTFTVTNGSSGADIVTDWESTLSDTKVPSEKLVKNTLDNKASNSHTHGNITRDGKIGSASGKLIMTGTGGVLQASDAVLPSIVTEWETTLSNNKVPSEKLVKEYIDTLIGDLNEYITR
jgi:hypothetical protein